MGVLKFKIFHDLWVNRGRTIQVVLIIGIGAAAIGMIMGTRNLIIPGMEEIWTSMNPAMVTIFAGPAVNEDELEVLKRTEGVEEIEGYNTATIEWRISPEDEWQQGALNARADYEDQKLFVLERIDGDWPSGEVISIGQDTEQYFGISPNSHVYLRVDDHEYKVPTGGTIYNGFSQPAYFGGTAQFFASQDRYEYLVGNRDYNAFYVTAPVWDEDEVTELADRLQEKLEKQGKDSGRFITDPNKHIFQDSMDGIFFLMGVLGGLALVLGLLLVYNTINNIILQQVDQIGVMKAVGARTRQIVGLYFATVFAYSILALAMSLPLGIFGAWGITSWLIGSFGADPGPLAISQDAVIVQTAIAVLAPLLAALIPIYNASRITVREAISTYGLSTNTGLIERLLAKARYISRMVLITISNTFRHKGRVVLMQIALVLSGLVFMIVVSVRDSVLYTVNDVIFAILNADITMIFEDAQRVSYIEEITLAHPDVKAVEMWGLTGANVRPAGQEESEDDESITMLGVPLPTQLYGHHLRAGRWLVPEDTHAIVLNQDLAEEIEVSVGDWVTVQYEEKNERDYQVVGMIFDPVITNSGHVPRDNMLRDIGEVDKAPAVWIQTERTGLEAEVAIAKDLRAYYDENHVKVSAQRGIFGIGGDSTTETATTLINQFEFLIILLAIMAIVIGAVGSIALSGALSLSVMERRREIGVMRAIGASSWSIFRLFIGEGLILGWLSWLIALPLSVPVGRIMVQAIGEAFEIDFVFNFTPNGAIYWLIIITLLSIFASFLPARGATRISVRESLAYQ